MSQDQLIQYIKNAQSFIVNDRSPNCQNANKELTLALQSVGKADKPKKEKVSFGSKKD